MRAGPRSAEAHAVPEDGRYGTSLFPVVPRAGGVFKGPIKVLHVHAEALSARPFRRAAFRRDCLVGTGNGARS
jgi:hypothetical protein